MGDKKLQEAGDPKEKMELLKLICSKLLAEPLPLRMDKLERQMLALKEQYVVLKRNQEVKEM